MSTESTTATGGKLSDLTTKMDEADMDRMVQQASAPNLAALFKKGKESGLIGPEHMGSGHIA